MNFRIENKYKLEKDKLFNLYEFLKENSAHTLYPKRYIKSVYFDNQTLSCYNDSIEGVVPRKKIRIRSYPNSKNVLKENFYNLEIKVNSADGKSKSSENKFDYNKLIKTGYYDLSYGHCFPNVEVSYFREYFSVYDFRVTIDQSINYRDFNKKKIITANDSIIVEVKSNYLESLNHIDEKFYFQKIRYSKYCNAVEEINSLYNSHL